MKKLIGLTAIVILFSLTVSAQGRNGGNRQGSKLTAEQKATLQTKKMTLRLDLNANQQKEVEKMLLQSAEERNKKRTEYREKKQSGELTADEQFTFENDRIERQLVHKKAMKKILNENQYEKWESEIMGKMNMNRRQNADCNSPRRSNKSGSKRNFNNRN
ncbi:hypothetical protein [Lutibacter flavus]|uniref:LTXXQ motif family protein n=1 Tax=Lutibacter flavus TaxID=691689 RepID=A0A238Z5G2_9FLAO|nr:hypothetical protein [Lutibacter flavus]SNR78422.1 hypothetical protein SAMN04488111_3065 [Lutibacter flavus]